MPFISYAQNSEDVMLWRALSHVRVGFYVDVGAWSPDLDSVTRAFSDKGWHGINIEPNPYYYAQLLERRPLDINLRVAVGDRIGSVSMNFIGDTGLSTVDPRIAESHKAAGMAARQEAVDLTTLAAIWTKHIPQTQAVHFLKVDVEGLEKEVLAGNDWQRNRPWIVLVEATLPVVVLGADLPLSRVESHEQWESLLIAARYIHCYSDGLNRYYVAEEHPELLDAFKFPPNVFDRFISAEVAHYKDLVQTAQALTGKTQHELSLLRERHRKSLAQALINAEALESKRVEVEAREAETHRRANAQLAELRARDAMVAEANQRAIQAAHQHQAILNSTSWRLTGPIRRIVSKIPAPLRSQARRMVKAAWWALTPWRLPQRLRFIHSRSAVTQAGAGTQLALAHGEGSAVVLSIPPVGAYAQWLRNGETRSAPATFAASEGPVVSFLIYSVESAEGLSRTLGSVRGQSHGVWEVILCQSNAADQATTSLITQLAKSDPRIIVVNAINGGEAACLEASLAKATGQFVAILDCGDLLAPHALNEFAAGLDHAPEADIFYSDEDEESPTHFRDAPYFKPGWSPDLLYAFNYFGRLTLLRRSLVQRAGVAADGGTAVEWDLNLRVSDLAQQIQRIPKVLCHRKLGSDRGRPAALTPRAADCRAVIERYWTRQGFAAVAETQVDGTQRVVWPMEEPPLVSIVIPTKNKAHLLRMCVDGLLLGTDYANKEIIIVDTGSDEPETLAYYEELRAFREIRIVHFRKKFNYSAACNYGASCAHGEMLLFLNNDIEVISRDWLQEMVRFALRPGVGVVGTKLIFPSLELQHGGVGIGIHLCALMYRSADGQGWSVFGSADHPRNWLAIMGACQLVRREAFERVGGFDEAYLVAMSDVALCLQIWRAGYRTAYAPHACLVHHEGATRGNANPTEDVRRIADDIRTLGIDEDPYLHPEMDGTMAIPTLRLGGAPSVRDILKTRIDQDGSLPLSRWALDLFNDEACLMVAGLPREAVVWNPQPAHKVCDKWSAARWCLDLLRSNAEVRNRFPKALSAGISGDFVHWLKADGVARFSLPATFFEAIEELFSTDISANARQTFLYRADVRVSMPHGLTPAGRPALFQWFIRHGRREGGLRLEEIWWLFWLAAENPSLELVRAYLFTPSWQRLYPDAMTVFGRRAFANWFAATYRAEGNWIEPLQWPLDVPPAKQLREAYYAREHWQTQHPRALEDESKGAAFIDWLQSDEVTHSAEVSAWCRHLNKQAVVRELVAPGVNVLGHFCYPSGLRVSVEALVDSLKRAGVATSLRDIRTDKKDDPCHLAFDGLEDFDITIIHTQPEPFFEEVYARVDLAERTRRTYRIAYWYWEFDSIPDSWIEQAATVDEVWVATEFVAKGVRERLSIPVRTLFPGVKLGAYQRRDREYFGLERGKYTFLFTFHMMSIMERKNPLGLIRAFKSAFTRDEPVCLVLKTSFGDRHPAQIEELRRAAADSNITIIDQVYSSDEVLSLLDACDSYVSLHRSEGLGLTMAEAMLMGKPVIATNYSGNVDFMDDSNSLLVPYKLKKLGRPIPPYDADFEWAEPSIEVAAQLMRRVYENQAWARELGERAKTSAEKNLALDAAGHEMSSRLAEIKITLQNRASQSF